jgi:hypothetical protein
MTIENIKKLKEGDEKAKELELYTWRIMVEDELKKIMETVSILFKKVEDLNNE